MGFLHRIKAFAAKIDQNTKAGRGLWLTGVALLVLVILFAVGKAFGSDESKASWLQWLVSLVGEVAKIGITAIVVGTVLKVLAVEGYFKSALVELFEGDRWIESLSAKGRIDLWHRLTRKIYIPSLDPDTSKVQTPERTSFHERLSTAISSAFTYQGREYMEQFRSEIAIKWEDPERKRVCIKTDASTYLVPFDADQEATWIINRTPEPHMNLDDYNKERTRLLIDGKPPTGTPIVETVGRSERTTHRFNGQDRYKIAYTEQVSWVLDKDPSMIRTAILVYDGYTLRIENQAEGLRVIFVEVGGTDLYDLDGTDTTDDFIDYQEKQIRTAKRVLLPGQGYQIIFVRQPTRSAPVNDPMASTS